MTLAENIRKVRGLKKISQADLAEMIGSHKSHLNRIETEKSKPSLDVLIKIAKALDVSIDYLLDEHDDFKEVKIEDKNLSQRIKLIETLDFEDRQALIRIIDSMLTKKKILSLVTNSTQQISNV